MRLEQIVEPGRPGAFFEGHGQSSTQSRQELQNGGGFGFQDGFHDYLALSIHHRYRDGCLMNVEPNTMWPSGLCREERKPFQQVCLRLEIASFDSPLIARHSFAMLQAVQK